MKKIGSRFGFVSWFILINALLSSLVGLRYFHWMPWPEGIAGWIYLLSTLPSHYWLLALVSAFPLFIIALFPIPRILLAFASVLTTALVVLIFIDTLVFDQYRFHISYFVIDLILNDPDGQIITFPWVMWLSLLVGLAVVLAGIFLMYLVLVRYVVDRKTRPWHILLLLLLLISHVLHAWADANSLHDVTRQARFYPLMQPTTAQRFMLKHGLVDEERLQQSRVNLSGQRGDLLYPRQPLQCQPSAQPMNILMLTLDSWRADSFSKEITPNLFALTQQHSQHFLQHSSGSNSTRGGIFSLFYGIPATYWSAFLNNGIPSPLVTELQHQGYDLGVFSSAQLRKPEFDRTVFATVSNLRIQSEGRSPSERDTRLTDDWLAWLASQQDNQDNPQPFFGFLFYDAPHGYDYPAGYPEIFQPVWESVNYFQLNASFDSTPFVNRYRNSVHFVDSQIARVIEDLRTRGLLDNTLILITGDHGQEFNDLGMNYWGHNSNFSSWQLNVPFILYAPGSSQRYVESVTTHHDVLPTLLSDYLGCSNTVTDYSQGTSLLQASTSDDAPWFIAASYSDYAFIGHDRIVTVDEFGRYTVRDQNYQPVSGSAMPAWVLQAMKQLSFYYSGQD